MEAEPKAPTEPSEESDAAESFAKCADGLRLKYSLAAHEYGKLTHKHLTALLEKPAISPATTVESDDFSEYGSDSGKKIYEFRYKCVKGIPTPNITAFARDHARIIHSASFRRLQGKCQLIPTGENEFFRTRLTHSLEVAEIGTRIARHLKPQIAANDEWELDLDVVNCACLLHDIGHPPFGHSGESVLDEKMKEYGGFEGNAQTFRLITKLENRLGQVNTVKRAIEDPRGLNLTFGVLASVLKYDKVITVNARRSKPANVKILKGYYQSESEIVKCLKSHFGIPDGEGLRTIECQIMDLADDIAYSVYDLEDTMEAGIVSPFDFFSVDDAVLELIANDISSLGSYGTVSPAVVLRVLSKVFDTMLEDADTGNGYILSSTGSGASKDDILRDRLVYVGRTYFESMLHSRHPLIRRQFLESFIQESVESVRVSNQNAEKPYLSQIKLDNQISLRIECMKRFNYYKVINSRQLRVFHHRAKEIIKYLFQKLTTTESSSQPGDLLGEYDRARLKSAENNVEERNRIVSDIIASMTDSEAIALYRKLQPTSDASFFSYR